MILQYKERCICDNGSLFCRDLKMIGERVVGNWWRKEGHRIDAEDVTDILGRRPTGSCRRHRICGFYGSPKLPSYDPQEKEHPVDCREDPRGGGDI